MIKWITAIIVSLLAGFAIARITVLAPEGPQVSPGQPDVAGNAPLEERIAALERAVREERDARQVLQDELTYLYDALEAGPQPAQVATQRTADDATGTAADAAARRARFERRNSPLGRAEQLVAGGFPEDQAAWIARRESELQMAAMQARYDARLSGNTGALREVLSAQADSLRTELGDQDYERYLEAIGGRTSATISNVLETSPAQRVGLQPGDQIVRYGGERIFNVLDLNRATLSGRPGETVLVDVRRDGTTFQVTMPRGPLGIRGR